jgi:hypothetical protein
MRLGQGQRAWFKTLIWIRQARVGQKKTNKLQMVTHGVACYPSRSMGAHFSLECSMSLVLKRVSIAILRLKESEIKNHETENQQSTAGRDRRGNHYQNCLCVVPPLASSLSTSKGTLSTSSPSPHCNRLANMMLSAINHFHMIYCVSMSSLE